MAARRSFEFCAKEPAAPGSIDRSARAPPFALGDGVTEAVAFGAGDARPGAAGFAAVLRSALGERGSSDGAVLGDEFGVRSESAAAVAEGFGVGRARLAGFAASVGRVAAMLLLRGCRSASGVRATSFGCGDGASAERSTRGTDGFRRSAAIRGSTIFGAVCRGVLAWLLGRIAVVGVWAGSATRRGNVAALEDCARSSVRCGVRDGSAGR
jgi:hypothetical protein